MRPTRSNTARVRHAHRRAGFSMLELLISLSVLSIVLSGFLFALHGEVGRMQGMVRTTYHELNGKGLLARVEDQLAFGRVITPEAFLDAAVGGGAGTIRVNSTAGFPDQGRLLLGPGEAREERLDYDRLDAGGLDFLDLTRGQACTADSGHPRGSVVRWAGTAHLIEDQSAPGAAEFDGVSQELFGQRFYRGDGTGVVFQSSIAAMPGESRFDGTDVRWGATVDGQSVFGGYTTVRFVPTATLTEADRNFDFNRDGDLDDSFDLGAIHLRSWDPSVPANSTDVALCPAMILQETCAPGGDMDGDGFDDPMFLIDRRTGWVRVRMFVLTGAINRIPVVQRLEMAVHARNLTQS